MKQTLAFLALGAVLVTSTGCMGGAGSDKDRLASLMTDTICMASDAMASITASADLDFASMTPEELQAKQEEITKKGEEMETKVKELPAKYGFADENAAEDSFKKLSADEKTALRKVVEEKSKSQCNPPSEMLNSGLDGFFNS